MVKAPLLLRARRSNAPREVVMDISGHINDFKSGYEETIGAKNFFLPEKIISSLDTISKSSGVEDFNFPI